MGSPREDALGGVFRRVLESEKNVTSIQSNISGFGRLCLLQSVI